jgi:hypothetical protein
MSPCLVGEERSVAKEGVGGRCQSPTIRDSRGILLTKALCGCLAKAAEAGKEVSGWAEEVRAHEAREEAATAEEVARAQVARENRRRVVRHQSQEGDSPILTIANYKRS